MITVAMQLRAPGNVEIAKAYLEGGSTSVMNKNAEPGKAYTESVTISHSTKGTAVNGKKNNFQQ